MDEQMRLETGRLYLYPLSAAQLKKAARDFAGIALELGLHAPQSGFWERRKRRRIYRAKRLIIGENPRAWLLTTAWLVCEKHSLTVVGEAGFKGPPLLGQIEIGYAMRPEYRGKGYMTEAVGALCAAAWAVPDYSVDSIMARTLTGNTASHRVLIKNGFARSGMLGKHYKWLKPRP
jgi:RimJ/RimL family protein N-acetyltransferase